MVVRIVRLDIVDFTFLMYDNAFNLKMQIYFGEVEVRKPRQRQDVYLLSESRIDADSTDFADFLSSHQQSVVDVCYRDQDNPLNRGTLRGNA